MLLVACFPATLYCLRTEEEGAEERGMAALCLRHAMGRENTRCYRAQLGAAVHTQALSLLSSCCNTLIFSLSLCLMM